MDEKAFLDKLQKAFDVEVDFSTIEEKHTKKRKEAALLESLSNVLNNIDKPKPKVEVVKQLEPIVEIVEVVETLPVPEVIMEIGRQPEPEIAKDDIVTKSVEMLSKTTEQDGDIQAVADKLPAGIQKELDIIRKSIADFHRFAQRHSQLGGGGAGDVVNLDHPAKTVYQNYTFTNKDYYIGIGATPLTITLPAVAKNGRVIAIKDINIT